MSESEKDLDSGKNSDKEDQVEEEESESATSTIKDFGEKIRHMIMVAAEENARIPRPPTG